MNAAVIGAGMAGLSAARLLERAGIAVTVFDKSKGTGGRLASRSHQAGWIDHGAPYFSAETQAFEDGLRRHLADPQLLQSWQPRIVGQPATDEQAQLIGVPRSSAVTRGLLGDLSFQPSTRITRLEADTGGWRLYNDGESCLGTWKRVVLAVPAPQALPLLQKYPEFHAEVARVHMEPCWVAAVETAERVPELGEVTIAPHPALRRITCNSAKPGRGEGPVYVLQASAEWSVRHLEDPPDRVGRHLHELFQTIAPGAAPSQLLLTHRWRYAFTERALNQPFLYDETMQLGICGDWCLGRRVEDAWRSGTALARALL